MVTPSAIPSQNFNKVFIMTAIKQVTKYETPDGLLFDSEDEAILHTQCANAQKLYEDVAMSVETDEGIYEVDFTTYLSWLTENTQLAEAILNISKQGK